MHPFNESYFSELERELVSLSPEERDSILRELRSHTEDASADPGADMFTVLVGLPEQAAKVGRHLRSVHVAARREARKRRSMLIISTLVASAVIVLSFIFPWFDGNLIAFVLGGVAVVFAVLSLVGVWMPKPQIGRWLVWSGSAGLTLVGMPAVISFSSFYLICGPLLLLTGMRLQRA
jgi:uncharacterized membrane protein